MIIIVIGLMMIIMIMVTIITSHVNYPPPLLLFRTEKKTEAIDFADESITHGSLHAHQGAWLYRPTAHQGACIDVGDWQTEADEDVTIGGSSKIERTVAPASSNGTTEEKNAMSSKSSPKKDKR